MPAAFLLAVLLLNGNKVNPGEFIIDHPTLINLGFEWLIEGDDNRNAQVEVSYRRQGETPWKRGLPLLRLQGERIYQNQGVFDVVSPNMFGRCEHVPSRNPILVAVCFTFTLPATKVQRLSRPLTRSCAPTTTTAAVEIP